MSSPFVLSGCGHTQAASYRHDRPVTIDGEAVDWDSSPAYYDEEDLSIAAVDLNAYFCLTSADRDLEGQIFGEGLTDWFDPVDQSPLDTETLGPGMNGPILLPLQREKDLLLKIGRERSNVAYDLRIPLQWVPSVGKRNPPRGVGERFDEAVDGPPGGFGPPERDMPQPGVGLFLRAERRQASERQAAMLWLMVTLADPPDTTHAVR